MSQDPEEQPKPGRPSKFNDAIREKIIQLAKAGKTEQQIAEIIGVHVNTIGNWKGRHQDLLWALNESKQVADELVEASLFSRAVGYSHPEVKVFCDKGEITEHHVQKHYPPDVTAGIFWLKNRKPEEWRDKQDVEHSGKVALTESKSDEELTARAKELIIKLGLADGE